MSADPRLINVLTDLTRTLKAISKQLETLGIGVKKDDWYAKACADQEIFDKEHPSSKFD